LASAVSVSDEILKLETNNRDGLLCKGRALGAQGNYSVALNTLEMAEKKSQPGFEKIIANIFIGNLHKNNHKNAEAITSYEKSLKICETEKNDKFKRINLNFIGDTHMQNNDLNAALASYLVGSKLAMNDNERAESFERLASTYSILGQHDAAIENQLKATLMQQKSGTLDEYANASYELGKAYEKAKEYSNAEKTYSKLLQFSKDNGGAYYEAKANYALGRLKAIAGDATNAKTLMSDALKMAKNLGENDLAVEIDASLKNLNN
jgi:tetratricopeptide (TPR) repeat protein